MEQRLPPNESTIHWQIHMSFNRVFNPLRDDIHIPFINDGILAFLMKHEYKLCKSGDSQGKYSPELFANIRTNSERIIEPLQREFIKKERDAEWNKIWRIVGPWLVDQKIRTSPGLRFSKFIQDFHTLTEKTLQENPMARHYPGFMLVNMIYRTDMRFIAKPKRSVLGLQPNSTETPHATPNNIVITRPVSDGSNTTLSLHPSNLFSGGMGIALMSFVLWTVVRKILKSRSVHHTNQMRISLVEQPQLMKPSTFTRLSPYNDRREKLLMMLRTHVDYVNVDSLTQALKACEPFCKEHTDYNETEKEFFKELVYIYEAGKAREANLKRNTTRANAHI
jgi:hypothetical protein